MCAAGDPGCAVGTPPPAGEQDHDQALEADLSGADEVFSAGAARGDQTGEQLGVAGEDKTRDEEGEYQIDYSVVQAEGGLHGGIGRRGSGDDDLPVIGNEGI